MKFVVFLILSLIITLSSCLPTQEVFQCKNGDEFLENSCNECYCLNNNQLVCQISRCKKPTDMVNCRVGTSWWSNCNKCWCVNVGTVCERKLCIPNEIE